MKVGIDLGDCVLNFWKTVDEFLLSLMVSVDKTGVQKEALLELLWSFHIVPGLAFYFVAV
jgi:hypothetical protein